MHVIAGGVVRRVLLCPPPGHTQSRQTPRVGRWCARRHPGRQPDAPSGRTVTPRPLTGGAKVTGPPVASRWRNSTATRRAELNSVSGSAKCFAKRDIPNLSQTVPWYAMSARSSGATEMNVLFANICPNRGQGVRHGGQLAEVVRVHEQHLRPYPNDAQVGGQEAQTLIKRNQHRAAQKAVPALRSVMVGTAEILLDDSLRQTEKAQASGVGVELGVGENMIQVWSFVASPDDRRGARGRDDRRVYSKASVWRASKSSLATWPTCPVPSECSQSDACSRPWPLPRRSHVRPGLRRNVVPEVRRRDRAGFISRGLPQFEYQRQRKLVGLPYYRAPSRCWMTGTGCRMGTACL